MQQLIKLESNKEIPVEDPLVDLKEILSELIEIDGRKIAELFDLLFSLFEDFPSLELKEETNSLDMSFDETKKTLKIKLKKRTKSKKLTSIGQFYLLRKKLIENTLTLIYKLYPPRKEFTQELQLMNHEGISPEKMVIKPLKPELMLDKSFPINSLIPGKDLPNFIFFEDLPRDQKTYEEKFGLLPKPQENLEFNKIPEKASVLDEYLTPEILIRIDNYSLKSDLNFIPEPRANIFEETKENLNGVIIEKYEKPLIEDGELVYEKIRIKPNEWTTVLDAIVKSGLRVSYKFMENGDAYITFLNDHRDGDRGLYIEYKVNGSYGKVAANRCIVPPGTEITLLIKTASSCPPGQDSSPYSDLNETFYQGFY